MRNYKTIKKNLTRMLILSMLPTDVLSASPETKSLIQKTLSKYCIPNDKTFCNTPYEGKYDPDTPFCLCNDGMTYNAESRKCQECIPGTYYKQSIKDNECKKCHPGSYSGTGAASCTSCSPGSYASGYGNTGCASCSPGTYQSSSGASSCYSCSSSNCETSGWGATSCYSRCGGSTPYCNGSGSCVECTSSSHCSRYCVNWSCVECRDSNDCGSNYSCSSGSCVCSLSESDCPCGKSGCSCNSPDTCGSDEERDGECGCRKKPEPPPSSPPSSGGGSSGGSSRCSGSCGINGKGHLVDDGTGQNCYCLGDH